jgi:hypothetical protein
MIIEMSRFAAGFAQDQSQRRQAVALHAIARWLRRCLADATRGWALAAGVPPDMFLVTGERSPNKSDEPSQPIEIGRRSDSLPVCGFEP